MLHIAVTGGKGEKNQEIVNDIIRAGYGRNEETEGEMMCSGSFQPSYCIDVEHPKCVW